LWLKAARAAQFVHLLGVLDFGGVLGAVEMHQLRAGGQYCQRFDLSAMG
jgi:hypothetical protein